MNGAVRIVNGRRPNEGSVQICVNGVWGHVCGVSYWSAANARVVCRQLGYSATCELRIINLGIYEVSFNLCQILSKQCIAPVLPCLALHNQ